MKRATLQHLRIPFSFYLLPVFVFAFSLSLDTSWLKFVWVGVILHLFLYPASNGYNSYFDKDEESIGGLKHPPKVSKELYNMALLFDAVALIMGIWIGWQFVLMLFVYGMVSKAYSHPTVRLKKMPYLGWFVAGFFQGYFTFLMVFLALNDLTMTDLTSLNVQIPAALSSLLLWGSYPMTQVYQHAEDGRRGDETISIKLGILGTFHFTAIAFSLATAGFVFFYGNYFDWNASLGFQLFLLPVLGYFFYWYWKVRKDKKHADYDHTMRLNFISALMMNLFFLVFYFVWLA